MFARIVCLSVVGAFCASAALSGSDQEFDATWHDSKAELDGYRLTVSRYGQERQGTAGLG